MAISSCKSRWNISSCGGSGDTMRLLVCDEVMEEQEAFLDVFGKAGLATGGVVKSVDVLMSVAREQV